MGIIVKFILILSFLFSGAIFGTRAYLHFQIQTWAESIFKTKLKAKVLKIGEEYDLGSNSFILSITPEKSEQKYLLNVSIGTDWSKWHPLTLKLELQSPGKDKGLTSFELTSHLEMLGKIITKFNSPLISLKEGELDVKIKGFNITSSLQLDEHNFKSTPHWSDLIWSNLDFNLEALELKHIISHLNVQQITGKGGYSGSNTGRFELKFDFNKEASFQLTPNNEFKIKSAISSIELEILDREKTKKILKNSTSMKSFDHIADLFHQRMGIVVQSNFKASQEGENNFYLKVATNNKNTLLQALQNVELKLKGKLHRRFGQELLSILKYVKFLQINPRLTKQKEGVKPEVWLSPILTIINNNSKQIITRILEEKYFNYENSMVSLQAKAKDFELSFNDKVFDQKVLEAFIFEQDYLEVGRILTRNSFEGFQVKFMPIFEWPSGVKLGKKGKIEIQGIKDKTVVSEIKVSEKKEEKSSSTQKKSYYRTKDGAEYLRKTKVISKRSAAKPKTLLQNHHAGIWYDRNRPNVKFYFYRGKNGIYYSEQFVMGQKGRAAKGTKLIFMRDSGSYKFKFPAFKSSYIVRPASKSKMNYTFGKYTGSLVKDKTYNAKIVRKYIELRKNGEI